jgi:hypothetical protein
LIFNAIFDGHDAERAARLLLVYAKSTYISHAVSNSYGTKIEIWAGFGPVGITEKTIWADYE